MKTKLATRNLRCRRREARLTLAVIRMSYRYMRQAILGFARDHNAYLTRFRA